MAEKVRRPLTEERMARLTARAFLDGVLQEMRSSRVKTLAKEWLTYRAYREGPSLFVIVNFTKCSVYQVDIEAAQCNCQDYQMNSQDGQLFSCKHLLFAAHVIQNQLGGGK